MTPLAAKALEISEDVLGYKETTGNNDGPWCKLLQRWAAEFYSPSQPVNWLDGEPWCCMHTTFCIWLGGKWINVEVKIPPSISTAELHTWAQKNGHLILVPVPGCVGLKKDASGNFEHTFLVETVNADGSTVHGIDGNWGNQVQHTDHLIAECEFMEIV